MYTKRTRQATDKNHEIISCRFCDVTKTLEFNLIYCELAYLDQCEVAGYIGDNSVPVKRWG